MKLFTLIVIAVVTVAASSCKKSSLAYSIVGRWSLVKDTALSDQTLPLDSPHYSYTGTPADYFEFTADGHFYSHLKSWIDTATYTINQQNEVWLVYSYLQNAYTPAGEQTKNYYLIKSVSAHNLTLWEGDLNSLDFGATTVEFDFKR